MIFRRFRTGEDTTLDALRAFTVFFRTMGWPPVFRVTVCLSVEEFSFSCVILARSSSSDFKNGNWIAQAGRTDASSALFKGEVATLANDLGDFPEGELNLYLFLGGVHVLGPGTLK